MYKSRDKPLPSPTYMSEEQKGQPSHMSLHALPYTPPRPSRLRECTVTGDTDLHNEPAASYLKDLRSPRASRPVGSRPPPPSKFTSLRRTETVPVPVPVAEHTHDDRPPLASSNSMPIMPAPRVAHRRADSEVGVKSAFAGRPLVRPPSATPSEPTTALETPVELRRPTSMVYMENGTRWMEKQEAKSLRMALQDMDVGEEKHIHSAAQDEAADLVWKHQNPDASFANPEAPYANPDGRKDYKSHLRRGSYQRSHSQEHVPIPEPRKSSGRSQRASIDAPTMIKRDSTDTQREGQASSPATSMSVRKMRSPSGKSYGGLAEAVADDIAKAKRRISSGSRRILSGEKKVFMHRNDRIWEDPEEQPSRPAAMPVIQEPSKPRAKPAATPVQPAAHVRKNPFARVRMQQDRLVHSNSAPVLPVTKHNSIEIQRNPPTQSRRAWYMSNEPLAPTPPPSTDQPADEVSPKGTPTKDGLEIRDDDIRAATSKQRKDRSPKLPQPTLVSDKPGRPIVSFQQHPKEKVLEEVHTAATVEPLKTNRKTDSPMGAPPNPVFNPPKFHVPRISVDDGSRPGIPTINFPNEPTIPTVVLPEEPDFAEPGLQSAPMTPSINIVEAPMINISGPDDSPAPAKKPAQRPLPSPSRPLPHHSVTSPLPRSMPHYTPSVRQSGALCAHCALPIAGRILSAAGQRFHPGCFVCHQCHTNLECVAFYPEPDKQRSERLERIHTRQAGVDVEVPERMSEDQLLQQEAEDGDDGLRFYCHLDFHELFSPRCKSCKTPIEGEVIVACGAEWHAGHFFCAQCGDPFDSSTPFVEKDGYAWCVGCHTNRYSSKCRKCRKPVTDLVVKALGSDWHDKCFVCMECNGEFVDGRYFLRGDSQDPVCVKCEEKRLKA
ncbi:hypothetical protein LTR36_005353 [Oleoguttula mirabilis]|uniref:LIM zinc-binding domain-containing protein n=1 Tax=Oleoguttula mirabilis TaxID=1507867 RepID=A0AAV9JEP7_9PEZI|nr:hypothetical protein LTR36_005353 [Oleoguttula mirabilis]